LSERLSPAPRRFIQRRLVLAPVSCVLAAVVLAAFFVVFGNGDAWAQVAQAMQQKPWVRCTLRVPKGMAVPRTIHGPEGWFSAEKKVFAWRADESARYIDLEGKDTYDYRPQTKTVN